MRFGFARNGCVVCLTWARALSAIFKTRRPSLCLVILIEMYARVYVLEKCK